MLELFVLPGCGRRRLGRLRDVRPQAHRRARLVQRVGQEAGLRRRARRWSRCAPAAGLARRGAIERPAVSADVAPSPYFARGVFPESRSIIICMVMSFISMQRFVMSRVPGPCMPVPPAPISHIIDMPLCMDV